MAMIHSLKSFILSRLPVVAFATTWDHMFYQIKSNNTLLKVDKPQPTKTSSRETWKTVQYQSSN